MSRVYTVENGRAVEHVVTVADRTPQEVVLSRGVEPNARVATDHLDQLSDGARVTQ